MHRRLHLIILIGLLAAVCRLPAQPTAVDNRQEDTMRVLPWPENVQVLLDSLCALPLLQTSTAGLMVYDLTADSVLFSYNAQQTLRPASTMKLFTAVTALDRLGGNYKFRTQLYHTGVVCDTVLFGDLRVVGGFDPRLDTDDLIAMAESVKQMGVNTICGNIVTDLTMKEDKPYGEGWCWDDDNPVLSPLTVGRDTAFAARFAQRLNDAGIIFTDTIASPFGEEPNPQTSNSRRQSTTVTIRTHSIDQVLQRMMKQSDNFYAEAMFFQIASSAAARKPARARDAATAIRQVIKKAGAGGVPCRIADGSGLSLYNYVTAEMETMLLRYAFHHKGIYSHLLPSLPIAGRDGTLKNRMQGTAAENNVRAKTGTLTAVSSLAGYATAANGHRLCFAVLNQGALAAQQARQFQDAVCETICRNYETPLTQ